MKTLYNRYLVAIFYFSLTVFLMSGCYVVYAYAIDPLPCMMRIYVNKEGEVTSIPKAGYIPRRIKVANIAIKHPGCYISCHSTNPDKAVYQVAPRIYVIGFIRIRGQYEGPFCRPKDYEKAQIRDEVIFKEICSKTFECIGNSCWAGPNTGELFGLK
jgi:hypothetical protein